MFFEELFHDIIELGKKGFNGYLLIIPSESELMSSSLSTSFFLLPFLETTSSSSDSESVASSHVPLLLLLGTSLGHEAHGWRGKRAFTCDGYSGDFFFIRGVSLFLFLLIFIFIVGGEPFTNIGTPLALEILLLAERCLALVLALLLVLLGLGALG